jgi:TonB family protein
MLRDRDLGGKPFMKYLLRLGIAVCLICSAFVFAQSSATSTERKQEPPASDANTQEPKQPHATTAGLGGIDVLTDTMGVDFGPYLQRVLKTVKQNWYNLSPSSARAPRMKRGVVSIEFAILKTGKIAGTKLVGSTGDVPLDHAAWLGITDTRFPPLPAEFSGQYLGFVSSSFTIPLNRAT